MMRDFFRQIIDFQRLTNRSAALRRCGNYGQPILNMKKTLPFFILFLVAATLVQAQKTVSTEQQAWLGFFSQARFSSKWGAWTDFHFRLKDEFVKTPSTGIVRFGLTYFLTDDVRLTAGYAWINHFPATGHANISQPEHRPWQQIQWFTRWPKARLVQSLRLEERFRRKIRADDELADGYLFNYRMRLNFALFLPLTAKGFEPHGWQFLLNNEAMLNFGKTIVFNHFDQNRLFAGLVYPFSKHTNVQAGYMNLYLQQASGNAFRNVHTVRLFFFHNFDWRN